MLHCEARRDDGRVAGGEVVPLKEQDVRLSLLIDQQSNRRHDGSSARALQPDK